MKSFIPTLQELKKYNINELKELCVFIRNKIISLSFEKSIHLASNLGVVELSTSLLYVFDSPNDKIIYDIGHQTYTHKILTGRYINLESIASYNGLSMFQEPCESVHDLISSGHAGSILSIAQGYCEHKKNNNFIVTVIGDASIVNGIVFEALNNISNNQTKIIIVLNDNGMSISSTVGGFKNSCNNNKIKNFFNSLDIEYIGIVDGNNIEELVNVFKKIKNSEINKPILIHVKTIKGLGETNAENDSLGKYHHTQIPIVEKNESYGYYANQYLQLKTSINNDIFVINPAMTYGSGFEEYAKNYKNNYEDVGICEEHALAKAVGIAKTNKKVFVVIYSSFLQRAYDQLHHDISRLNIPITLLIDKSEIAYKEGDTHHGIYDLAFLKTVPNTTITCPSSRYELNKLIDLSLLNTNNIFAIRYSKSKCIDRQHNIDFEYGDWIFMQKKDNSKTLIITYGDLVNNLVDYYNNKEVDLLNAIFLTNYDKQNLIKILQNYKNIYVVENVYYVNNLYFDIVKLLYESKICLEIHSICITNSKIGFGQKDIIDKQINMDIESIVSKIQI